MISQTSVQAALRAADARAIAAEQAQVMHAYVTYYECLTTKHVCMHAYDCIYSYNGVLLVLWKSGSVSGFCVSDRLHWQTAAEDRAATAMKAARTLAARAAAASLAVVEL